MKKFWITLTLLLTMVGGLTLINTNPVTAQAVTKHYTVVPKTLRGHWRHYDKKKKSYDKVIFTKWEVKSQTAGKKNWFSLSGKTFKVAKRAKEKRLWHSDLSVTKLGKHQTYAVGQSYTDMLASWQRVKRNGKTALRCTPASPAQKVSSTYYYGY
ncbi:hypothetical protein ACFQ44_05480 [Levilactobacillus lanxiensis]|uniref:Uncharacterized protein n=1 Tax=Levilactobacillus lanxiensis TaxID=2799568 RepID=A0ABW4D526_9LACO|nr:hypothetical protein [Levilactobacillus lanxiensis]